MITMPPWEEKGDEDIPTEVHITRPMKYSSYPCGLASLPCGHALFGVIFCDNISVLCYGSGTSTNGGIIHSLVLALESFAALCSHKSIRLYVFIFGLIKNEQDFC